MKIIYEEKMGKKYRTFLADAIFLWYSVQLLLIISLAVIFHVIGCGPCIVARFSWRRITTAVRWYIITSPVTTRASAVMKTVPVSCPRISVRNSVSVVVIVRIYHLQWKFNPLYLFRCTGGRNCPVWNLSRYLFFFFRVMSKLNLPSFEFIPVRKWAKIKQAEIFLYAVPLTYCI